MKKFVQIAFVVLLVAVAAHAVYRFGFRKSIPDAPVAAQVEQILEQNDCFVCHSAEPKLPFYVAFPVIGPTMRTHVNHAFRFCDLDSENFEEISEVGLSMIEYAIHEENMPIAEYRLIHWGTGFNRKEQDVLVKWARDQRQTRFNEGYSARKYAFEPVRPVPESVPFDEQKARLGFDMYNDGRISADGTISCASCHLLEIGGADEPGSRTSEGINGQFGGVNAPTVYNSYFNVQQFWNGRAANLAEQAAGPPVNPVEMGAQTWDDIVARLRSDSKLVKRFDAMYPGVGLTAETVCDAIAEFEKTLLTPDSRFDLYLKGNTNAISEEEEDGYEEFVENACATCHTGIILGGQSFSYLGIFGDYFADRDSSIAYNSDDDGLFGFTGIESDLHKFKVPGLRNVALTAPYFHDGSIATLEDAVRAMDKYELGGVLSNEDVREIVAFMNTLTGNNQYLAK